MVSMPAVAEADEHAAPGRQAATVDAASRRQSAAVAEGVVAPQLQPKRWAAKLQSDSSPANISGMHGPLSFRGCRRVVSRYQKPRNAEKVSLCHRRQWE